jgi:glutaredoxin 3
MKEETMSVITIYTRALCAYCNLAKRLLKERGLVFREIDLTTQPNIERDLVVKTGQRTVPQIFIGDQFIGGYRELASLSSNGQLTSMLTG